MAPQVDVSTGKVSFGTLESGEPFEFTITSAISNDVTLTALDSNLEPYEWFTSDPATITAGSTSVTVEATEPSPPGSWLTYSVKGINVTTTNPHLIIVTDGD